MLWAFPVGGKPQARPEPRPKPRPDPCSNPRPMPELPEVETTRRGLTQSLPGRTVTKAIIRQTGLRWPIPADLPQRLEGQRLAAIERRAKYLLFRFPDGTLLAHLGMTGTLRLLPADLPAEKHDHVDIVFGDVMMRFRDPRRFGALLWIEGDPASSPLLEKLGPEPLEAGFTAEALFNATRNRSAAIKPVIMDAHVVVGVGNIYASESLFRAGIRPTRAAKKLSRPQCAALVAAIRETLTAALAAGGSTLRDFFSSDGSPGYFQQQYFVYERENQPCRRCATPIKMIRQAQRASYYCPRCQRG